jgi:hypothetical protein
MASPRPAAHELDVTRYSLDELFGLFGLRPAEAGAADLAAAKKVVLMTHPDKSRLAPAYFLFYKKAYDIVAEFVAERSKIDAPVPAAAAARLAAPVPGVEVDKRVKRAIDALDPDAFGETFNAMFDAAALPRVTRDDAWFRDETAQFDVRAANAGGMAAAIDRIRAVPASRNAVMCVAATASGLRAGDAYDAPDPDAEAGADVFSKLKYEDVRKVHKDQTVFAVSDARFVPPAAPAKRERTIAPMAEPEAKRMLASNEEEWKAAMLQKSYDAKLRGMAAETAQRSALSKFLRLT